MAMICPSCGNSRNFLVKTMQMHVVQLEDSDMDVINRFPPAVLEVLCDECDTAVNLDTLEEHFRKELLLTLGVG
jgi:hypothetical protein